VGSKQPDVFHGNWVPVETELERGDYAKAPDILSVQRKLRTGVVVRKFICVVTQ